MANILFLPRRFQLCRTNGIGYRNGCAVIRVFTDRKADQLVFSTELDERCTSGTMEYCAAAYRRAVSVESGK